jgi:hypothetical protein
MIERGCRFDDGKGEIRVMAVADGYAMCRRRGASPFILTVKEVESHTVFFKDEFVRVVVEATDSHVRNKSK